MTRYEIFIRPQAWDELKALPGNMRQRMRREIDNLAVEPRPTTSKALDTTLPIELRRLRLDRWRLVYLITEEEKWVDVLAVRKRPPYDYDDLASLLAEL